MKNFYFIGVDVSKKKLDFCVMFEEKVVYEEEAVNHQGAIMYPLHHWAENHGIGGSQMLVCVEIPANISFL